MDPRPAPSWATSTRGRGNQDRGHMVVGAGAADVHHRPATHAFSLQQPLCMENCSKGKTLLHKNLGLIKVRKTTAYMVMRQSDENIPMSRKSLNGRPAKEMSLAKWHRLQVKIRGNIGVSWLRAEKKINIMQQWASHICSLIPSWRLDHRGEDAKCWRILPQRTTKHPLCQKAEISQNDHSTCA